MRAAVVTSYGGPETIRLVSLPDPLPGSGQLLVRVRAASVNPLDIKLRGGALRRALPLRFPAVLGFDFAGVVEGMGPGVSGGLQATASMAGSTLGVGGRTPSGWWWRRRWSIGFRAACRSKLPRACRWWP